jgi:hypothetical protein
MEIERQLDYIPGEDHDSGASPGVAIYGPAVAPTMTGSAFERMSIQGRYLPFQGSGSGPSCLSSPPHAVGTCAGGSTICDHDEFSIRRSYDMPFRTWVKPYSQVHNTNLKRID